MASSPRPPHPLASRRRLLRRLLTGALGLVLIPTVGLLAAGPASADSSVSPKSGSFLVTGSGYGHGYGMSQYGAYGAARSGLEWREILEFYYPGTDRDTLSSGTKLKVWVTADSDGSLRVLPASGLKVTDANGKSYSVPSGSDYKSWRISRSGSGFKLVYRNGNHDDVTKSTKLGGGPWSFSASDSTIRLVLPSGSTRNYRGSLSLIKYGSGSRTVNKVLVEDYVSGVVPSEMPTSWAAEAIRAQAVAARTYAVFLRDSGGKSGYDICDTTACQVYAGSDRETAAGNAAVRATAGRILTYHGAAAFTQFASSNGGHSARGSYVYLAAHSDPYDGKVKSQAWSKTISASSIRRAWPSVGSVQSLKITDRDGAGAWGGRVRSIKISGSSGSVTVTGSAFYRKFGMRSTLFTFSRSAAGA